MKKAANLISLLITVLCILYCDTLVKKSSTRLETRRDICQYWEDMYGGDHQLTCTSGRECGMGNVTYLYPILGMKVLETWSVVRRDSVSSKGVVSSIFSKLTLCSRVTSEDVIPVNVITHTSEEERRGTEENNLTEFTDPGDTKQDIKTEINDNTLNYYVTNKTKTTMNPMKQTSEEEESRTEENNFTVSTDAVVIQQDKETKINDNNINNYVTDKSETIEDETSAFLILQTSEEEGSGTEENNCTESSDPGDSKPDMETEDNEINFYNFNNYVMEKTERREDKTTVNTLLQKSEGKGSGTEENNFTEYTDAGVIQHYIETEINANNLSSYVTGKTETREDETKVILIVKRSEEEGSGTVKNKLTESANAGDTKPDIETEIDENTLNNYVTRKTQTIKSNGVVISEQNRGKFDGDDDVGTRKWCNLYPFSFCLGWIEKVYIIVDFLT